jgi:hypothetical protein
MTTIGFDEEFEELFNSPYYYVDEQGHGSKLKKGAPARLVRIYERFMDTISIPQLPPIDFEPPEGYDETVK